MLSDRPQDVSNHIEEGAGSPDKFKKRLNVDEKKRPNTKVKGRARSHDVDVTRHGHVQHFDDPFLQVRRPFPNGEREDLC